MSPHAVDWGAGAPAVWDGAALAAQMQEHEATRERRNRILLEQEKKRI